MKLALTFLLGGSLFAQAPPITGVGHDAVTSRSARIHWTSGFYHDTTTDTTLQADFQAAASMEPLGRGASLTITVGSTANMKGWVGMPNGTKPTSIIIGGTDMARVEQVIDGTHAAIVINDAVIGGNSYSENQFWALPSDVAPGLSVSVHGGVATATLPYPPAIHWTTGHNIKLDYWSGGPQPSTIITRPDDTHITFAVTCSPACDGGHDATTDPDMRLQEWTVGVHHTGETISFISSDGVVCYGDPNGPAGIYPHSQPYISPYPRAEQVTKHWVQLTGQTPGSRVHYIVLSTPHQMGSSNCSSIGPHTGRSSDNYIDFPANEQTTPTPPAITFTTDLPSSYADSKVVGTDCPDLQTCLNTARSTPGNHELKIPAGTLLTGPPNGWILPAQSNGSLVTTIRTTAPDSALPAPGACLPPFTPGLASPCIDSPRYVSSLAVLQSNGTTLSSLFRVGDMSSASGMHIGPGLKIMANTQISVAAFGLPFINLWHPIGAGAYGHAYHTNEFVVDRVYFYQKNIQNGNYSAIFITGGHNVAVVDCVMEGIVNRVADVGGIFVQGVDAQDGGYVFKNNRIEAAFDSIYLNGDGWNTGPGVMQQNWFHMRDSWNHNDRSYPKQVQVPVATATAGSTTTITLAEPTEFGQIGSYPYYLPNAYVSFTGFVGPGTWDKLNAREFTAVDGTLLDVTCASGSCTAQTSIDHGFAARAYIWLGGLSGTCANEVGAHQIATVVDSTHLQWASGTSGRCMLPDGGIMGPVFHPNYDNNTWTIPFDSTGFPQVTGSPTARYGMFVNTKNLAECKTCVGWDISGNLFDGSITHEQNAVGFALTNKTTAALTDYANWGAHTTVADIYFHDNWFRRVGLGISIQGLHDYLQNMMMNRVAIKNNLFSYSTNFQCTPNENCVQTATMFSFGNNIVWDHNTSLHPGGIASQALSPPPYYGNWTVTNSIFDFGNTGMAVGSSGGFIHWGAQVYQTSGTGTTPEPPFTEQLLTIRNNAFTGFLMDTGAADDWNSNKWYYDGRMGGSMGEYQKEFWPHNLTGLGFAGLIPITNATNSTPIVLRTSTMACIPDAGDKYRVSAVRGNLAANGDWVVTNPTATSLTLVATSGTGAYMPNTGVAIPVTGKCNYASNWALGSSSPYKAGTSFKAASTDSVTAGQGAAMDGNDLGANISSLTTAIGGGTQIQCLFTVDPTSANFPADGGPLTLTVTATAPSCSWSVTNSPGWMTFDPAAGIGSAQITATALPNPGALRRGYPVVAGQTFSVSQDVRAMPLGETSLGTRVRLSSTAVLR